MRIEKYNEIITYLRGIIEGSNFEGHLFSVGGCERDKHLGNLRGFREIKDIDLVLDIPNGGIEFANWLNERGLLVNKPVTYEHYGTAMFHLKAFPEEELESVQTRKESYRDMETRNPETAFGTIQEDCVRRDFTINALYHNISTGEDLDLTGKGLDDLEDGIIRATADPDVIFFEDPLRIMRAIRFACKYGFEIEDDTYRGIKKYVERLSIISEERITDEFNKIILSENRLSGIITLVDTGIFKYLFPEVGCPECLIRNVQRRLSTRKKDSGDERIIAFLSVMLDGPLCDSEAVLIRMRYPLKIINGVKTIHESDSILKDIKNLKKIEKIHEIQYHCKTKEMFECYLSFLAYYKELNDVSIPGRSDGEMYGYKLPVNGFDIMEYCNITSGKQVKGKIDILMKYAYKNPYTLTRNKCLNILREKKSLWHRICSIF